MIRAFCSGESLAKTDDPLAPTRPEPASVRSSISLPSATCSTSRPTSRQILRVTSSLSPVRIFTATPCSREHWQWPPRRSPWAGRGRRCSRSESGRIRPPRCKSCWPSGNLLVGHRDDAKAVLVQVIDDIAAVLRGGSARAGDHRRRRVRCWVQTVKISSTAPLQMRMCLPPFSLDHHRHAPALEVERNLVHFGEVLGDMRASPGPRRARAPPRRAGSSVRSGSSC